VLPRLLSFAIPLFVYVSLGLILWGLYRDRARLDRWLLALIAGAFLYSLALRPNEHLLFFDEDIYINIASNLSHAPVAQLTLMGTAGEVQSSTYYKEPAGFPAMLGLVFLVTGTNETAAFVFARLLYALAAGAVYLLARELKRPPGVAIVAAVFFAAAPACFAYSATTGTDLPAALFAALGLLGILSGNAPLAAGAIAMTAQVRLEMIALAPLLLLAPRIPLKWKAGGVALLAAEVTHVLWVLSLAPTLAKAEHVDAAFALKYVAANSWANAKYLFDPFLFPIAATVLAAWALRKRVPEHRWLVAWFALIGAVYLLFYAGSFGVNPRYSIQLTIPIVLLAVTFLDWKPLAALLALTLAICGARPWVSPGYVQALALDHQKAVALAQGMGADDLVIASEPEVFINQGRRALHSIFATEQTTRIREQFGKYRRILYYAGIRTNEVGSQQWEADRRVKSEFELHLVESTNYVSGRIAVYELLQPVHRVAGQACAFDCQRERGETRRGGAEVQE
jgi:hypothetical protein